LWARKHHGAVYGIGEGRTGNSYAIPTKDRELRTLSIEEIARYAARFIAYARQHPHLEFQLTAVGCGLAGYQPPQIAPLFRDVPANVTLPPEFVR
jgi:hypothetical protein